MSGWETVKLADVTIKVGSGATPRGGSESYEEVGIPLVRSMNVHFDSFHGDGLVFLNDEQASALQGVEVKANDVLLNITGASIGRVTQAPPDMDGARVNQHVCIIRTREGLDQGFLARFLASPVQQRVIMTEQSGVTRQALTKEKILDFDIPLPPLNEQRRIVAKIEELSARSRRAREALKALPALLEQFRQSVLAAAFRGDLTADWRKAHPDTEPASALLDRIRQERRHRWEQANPKKRYFEPEPVDPTALPELPEGWCLSPLPLIAKSELGKMLDRSKHVTGRELPYLRNFNVRWGEVDTNDLLTMFFEEDEIERYKVCPGDVVVCEGGEPGRATVWPVVAEPIMYQKALHRVRPQPGVASWWIVYSLWNDAAAGRLLELMSGTTIKHLTGEALTRYTLPLAPEIEQSEIIRRVQSAMDMLSGIDATWLETTDKLNACDQSILAKAFRGELLPQDPADEPASLLLERLRAAREAAGTPRKPGRRGRKRGGTSGDEAQDAGEPAPAPAALERKTTTDVRAAAAEPRALESGPAAAAASGRKPGPHTPLSLPFEPEPDAAAAETARPADRGKAPARPQHVADPGEGERRERSDAARADSHPRDAHPRSEKTPRTTLDAARRLPARQAGGFVSMDCVERAGLVFDALWGLGPVEHEQAVRIVAEHLREKKLAEFQRLRTGGTLWTDLEDAIEAARKNGLVDCPKRGWRRAVLRDADDYLPEDWQRCVLAVGDSDPMDEEAVLRRAAEWARENLGLRYERLEKESAIWNALNGARLRESERNRGRRA